MVSPRLLTIGGTLFGGFFLTVILSLFVWTITTHYPPTPDRPSLTPVSSVSDPCREDEGCWVWSTMGNRQRGVYVTTHPGRVTVSPCRYSRLRRMGLLDTDRTRPLKGDHRAFVYGCGDGGRWTLVY